MFHGVLVLVLVLVTKRSLGSVLGGRLGSAHKVDLVVTLRTRTHLLGQDEKRNY
jgi:hypothetical protein